MSAGPGSSLRPPSVGAGSSLSAAGVGVGVSSGFTPGPASTLIRSGSAEGGDMYFEQDFTTPSATWTITHNFGKSPNVRIVDANGNTAYPATQDSTDLNTVYVEWPAPMTGKAICS